MSLEGWEVSGVSVEGNPFAFVKRDGDGWTVYIQEKSIEGVLSTCIIVFHQLPTEKMAQGFADRINRAVVYWFERAGR